MPEFLNTEWLGKPTWLWLMFHAIVLVLMALDLGLLNNQKKNKEISIKGSFALCGFYILMAVFYGIWVWWQMGQQPATEFLTGYVVEFSLSMDNIFVISLIITHFGIPRQHQHRVLFWGIIGVIIMRGIMIGVGAALVREFEWILYIFAAFLIITGIKMLFSKEKEMDVTENMIIRFISKHFRVTKEFHGSRFFVKLPPRPRAKPRKNTRNVTWVTPLFVALMVVNFVDVIFAVDSVPAIFAITTDTFIVYTSNIFAILGLRALYFALSAMVERFKYLKYALATVLIFIGGKLFLPHIADGFKLSTPASLIITIAILVAGIIFSLVKTRTLKTDDALKK